MIFVGALLSAGCLAVDAISPERADTERAAIQRDLKNDWPTLCKIAAQRAKLQHPELATHKLACVVSDTQATFFTGMHARYTVSYACGIAPWRPNRTPPAATPAIPLDLLKEHGTWTINGFL